MLTRLTAATLGLAALATPTLGQNLIYNPSFEELNVLGPVGWRAFNSARYRTTTDGLTPAVTPRTGDVCIELVGDGSTDFSAFTTDVFDPIEADFYNPDLEVPSGDVTVTGWYMIPADRPLTDAAGIKLEFRRENSSIWQAIETRTITGHTNGEWVQFSVTIPAGDLDPANQGGDPPTQVSVLPLFFSPGGVETGTIFWDDFELTQGEPPCILEGDLNNDDVVDVFDLLAYLDIWFDESANGCP